MGTSENVKTFEHPLKRVLGVGDCLGSQCGDRVGTSLTQSG
ncbi:MAG TPA: hypothetical protein VFB63_00735 [Bryobacteraceae bacterium]|jgi:hypothetical protein|nr:hypothetical protein [Bryobacteraceae bacterium]